jgi:hypothetical protein
MHEPLAQSSKPGATHEMAIRKQKLGKAAWSVPPLAYGRGRRCSGRPVNRAMRKKSLSRVNTLARCSIAMAAIGASIVVKLMPRERLNRKIAAASR